jgi:hypothetical protein
MTDAETTHVDDQNQGWLTTKRRIAIAIAVLVVVAVLLVVVDRLIKSKSTELVSVADPVTSIEVDSSSGTIKLIDGSDLSITRTDRYVFKKPSSEAVVENGVLRLEGDCGGLRVGDCSVSFDVAVPANIPVSVKAAGSVKVTGLKSDVSVDVKSAAVDMEDTYGRVEVKTTNGDVSGVKVSSRDVKVETKSGGAEMQFASSPNNVEVVSDSGAVTVQVPKSSTAYNIDAVTRSGKMTVDVRRDTSSPFAIKARSESGNVTVQAR